MSARCMFSSFVSLGFTKSWVGQVALRSPILNPLKTSGGQPVALGGFGVWLGGYFFGSIDLFVFVDFRVFYERFVA